jgi:hypothetical protein
VTNPHEVRSWFVTVRSALPIVLAALGACGCDRDEPEPPDPPNPVEVVESAAQRFLDAGPSELTVEVRADRGGDRYELRETLDPDSRWFRTEPPRPRPSIVLATRSPITGPAFSFGSGDTGRAYVGPIQAGGETCWVEAHAPAGRVRGGLSAEEALVTAHTVLALLTRNVKTVSEPTLDLGELAPFFADNPRTFSLHLDPPDSDDAVDLALPPGADATNRYVNDLRQGGRRIVDAIAAPMLLGIKDQLPSVLVVSLSGGRSALDFTPPRPASSVIVTFDAIGGGEPVREPECLGME